MAKMKYEGIIDLYITKSEDERTAIEKQDFKDARRITIDAADASHHQSKANAKPELIQQGKNIGYVLATTVRKLLRKFTQNNQKIRFNHRPTVAHFHNMEEPIMITYDSGADNQYMSEADRIILELPILQPFHKRVAVSNGGTIEGKYVTCLPFPQLSTATADADTFEEFLSSLMSVGKTSDDGNISIFTDKKVQVYKEADVLITCRGKPILIGKQDERGRYRIPLMQTRGQWQPQKPSNKSKKFLQEANSAYDLPSTEEAISGMHAVCGYPVKSTWIKAIRAGNSTALPILNKHNMAKYYPETTKTPKGHLNQTRKNVRSTKPKTKPFEKSDASILRGKKVRDVYTKVYDV